MGTRGTWGYILNEEKYLTYNHFDSYPSELGAEIYQHVSRHAHDLNGLRERVAALRVVDEQDPAPVEDQKRLVEFHDAQVSTGQTQEWYSLLRNTQGQPELALQAGVITDGSYFPQDSLFCEWAYVIDLDHERLEVYEGFQTEPHDRGRFADQVPEPRGDGQPVYQPVALIAVYPLGELPSTTEDFVADVESHSQSYEEMQESRDKFSQ